METTTIFEYLSTLPASELEELYKSPRSCHAVFRSLSPLAKQYLLRLVFISSPPLMEHVAQWHQRSSSSSSSTDGASNDGASSSVTPESKHRQALEQLASLRICETKSVVHAGNQYVSRPMRDSTTWILSTLLI